MARLPEWWTAPGVGMWALNSYRMQLHLNPREGVPIYRQIVNQVKYLVAAGRLAPGEELPPIRLLAGQLVINPNTVARAYMELEHAGIVTKRHGSGTYISENGSPLKKSARRQILNERADTLAAEAAHLGVELPELLDIMRERHAALNLRERIMNPVYQPETTPVIQIQNLSRRFGGKQALDQVNLEIPRGQVFGLVGANGAGKTTLLKHILGLLRADSGSVRVFGLDPTADAAGVLGRIGFLSEDRDLPGWMRVDELLRYTMAFYPGWDMAYANHLQAEFGLPGGARVKSLSRGELAKTGLLLALAHRPELLVLDEPSSGLDPMVRREILEAIVRAVAEEGRTVFFSSHLLDEIERVSDQVAMMATGRIVLQGRLDEILESHHRLTFRFPTPQKAPPRLAGALRISGAGSEWTAVCNGARAELIQSAAAAGAQVVSEESAGLDEIFIARVGERSGPAPTP